MFVTGGAILLLLAAPPRRAGQGANEKGRRCVLTALMNTGVPLFQPNVSYCAQRLLAGGYDLGVDVGRQRRYGASLLPNLGLPRSPSSPATPAMPASRDMAIRGDGFGSCH